MKLPKKPLLGHCHILPESFLVFFRYNCNMEVRYEMIREEQILREIYGYTDEQLLEDARQAEEELVREDREELRSAT